MEQRLYIVIISLGSVASRPGVRLIGRVDDCSFNEVSRD